MGGQIDRVMARHPLKDLEHAAIDLAAHSTSTAPAEPKWGRDEVCVG